ncbi:hypothetical protein RSal33209_0676 [Renibacterium salmoninarum ATCC 33209]|uniref:Uncharacterized protein n=1 Tax=Renibacterium salmoninarum (strain ATCC 33209 / DSM 20767 / JCM 11484 / NBRC 15589 / NCIMB 2235) TaxID=288705 RepID=A9WPX8_RENSM|nr:hypothetical protein RSal33209_0676 [Renibacterium salmoninarum ATCC 33209]
MLLEIVTGKIYLVLTVIFAIPTSMSFFTASVLKVLFNRPAATSEISTRVNRPGVSGDFLV